MKTAAALCLAVSLAGCSGEATSQLAQPASTRAADAAIPATATKPAPAAEQTPGPLPATSNEPDQAGPASQAEAELALPVQASGTDSQPAKPISAQVAAATKTHAVATAGSQVASATRVTQTQHALPAQFTRAQRAQRFRQVSMQLKAPVLLAGTGKTGGVLYSLKFGNIGISNLDNSVLVHFAMKSMDAEWRNEALAAERTQEFGCGLPQQDCLFWMRTGTRPAVFYKMHAPQRYAIVWDGDRGLWDLRLVDQAGP